MKDMKIGKRLIIGFIIVAVIASISGVVSIFTSANSDKGYSDAITNYGFAQGDIGKAMLALADSRRCVRDIVSYTDAKYIDAAKAKNEENVAKYAEYTAAVEKTLVTEEAQAQYKVAQEALALYNVKKEEVLKLGDTTDEASSNRARIMMAEELDPLYDEVYAAWTEIMRIKVDRGTELSDSLTEQSRMIMVLSIVLTVASMVIAVVFGIFISRGISNPIQACVTRLNHLAEGNLTEPVPEIQTKDETGMLADATKTIVTTLQSIIADEDYLLGEMGNGNFDVHSKTELSYVGDFQPLLLSMEKINESLSDALGQINETSGQVTAGSEQVAQGAQSLAEASTDQSSSIEELSATMQEISEKVQQTATNAQEGSDQSDAASVEVKKCNVQMDNMVDAMNEIQAASKEISNIIGAIEDIASQTNLLSLNAAIEAARAGDAGRGFAVVAEEVRKLAGESSEAVQNTAQLIERSIQAVEKGIGIANDTAASMTIVVDKAQSVASTINIIANAANGQAESIAQIMIAVNQISDLIQSNSATSEESSAASEELLAQAQVMKELVGRFTLKA
ncbi:MAG: HAMP domain-containing methyl-accepting chemotaxis protein [Lachnospiraceae bacterium]